MDKQTLLNIINQLGLFNVREEDISPFLAEEDGKEYSVWHIKTSDGDYVLKVAKEKELGHRMGILGCSTAEMKMSLGC